MSPTTGTLPPFALIDRAVAPDLLQGPGQGLGGRMVGSEMLAGPPDMGQLPSGWWVAHSFQVAQQLLVNLIRVLSGTRRMDIFAMA